MRRLVMTAALALVVAAPAWAQPHDMPGMQHPQEHRPPPSPPPPVRKPAAPSPAAPAPSGEGAQPRRDMGSMPGMAHGDHAPPRAPAGGRPTHEAMPGMRMEEKVGAEPSPAAPTDHAAEIYFDAAAMRSARDRLRREQGGAIVSRVFLKLGEYQSQSGEGGYRWDGEAWIGGDVNRLVIKSEGEGGSDLETGEVQALYSRAIMPFFDLQAGVRQDFEPRPQRTYAAVSVEGIAPYWFDVEGALFLSDRGEVLGRLEGTYDFLLTQRLVLQPRIETNLAAEDIPEIGVNAGFTNLELGLRLRYDIRREFAPYVGVSFDRRFGAAADYARRRGEDASETSAVLGLRAWF